MTPEEARDLGYEQAESEIAEGATRPVENPRAMYPDLDGELIEQFELAYQDTWYWYFITHS